MNEQIITIIMMLYCQHTVTVLSYILEILMIIPIYAFGFRIYIVTTLNTQRNILSKIKWSTKRDENNKANGYFTTAYCIGYYDDTERILKLICSEQQYQQLTSRPSIDSKPDLTRQIVKKEKTCINVFHKNCYIEYISYKSRLFNVSTFSVLKNQVEPVQQILNKYESSIYKSVVCLLHGSPNTGKSMVSILVAKALEASYCKSYKPIEAGDSMDTLYNTCNPSAENPLVILLDEFDIMLEKIHNDKIIPNNKVLTEVTDKISWNQLLDNISIGFYPFTIFILTTNINPVYIVKNYDSSYIRENRCHLIMEMTSLKKD